jgi:prepilin-type N-terminal cleavage/methylation domain-containing protein
VKRLEGRAAAAARGYTAVEVLIAMTVMAIGAAAVMTMQKASVQGNLDARRLDVANGIARMWEERLQADAMAWTTPNATTPTSNLATTNGGNGGQVADALHSPGTWILPTHYSTTASPEAPQSYIFDILGRDLYGSEIANAVFCVAVRLTPLVPPASAPALIRADVRVLWQRGLGSNPNGGGFCVPGSDATSDSPSPDIYHALYVTTALKENPAP